MLNIIVDRIREPQDANIALRCGANVIAVYVGNAGERVWPRDIEDAERRLAYVPIFGQSMLIVDHSKIRDIANLVKRLRAKHVQVSGSGDAKELAEFTREYPEVLVFPTMKMRDGVTHVMQQVAAQPAAAGFVLDASEPLGVTYRHDWDTVRLVAAATGKPVIIGGGLTDVNVGQAILECRPHSVIADMRLMQRIPQNGLDLRTPEEKMRAFVRAVKKAAAEIA